MGRMAWETLNEGCSALRSLWLAVLRCAAYNTDAGENPTHAHNAEKEGQEQGQGADDGS